MKDGHDRRIVWARRAWKIFIWSIIGVYAAINAVGVVYYLIKFGLYALGLRG